MDDRIARALKDLRPYTAGALKDLRRNWGGAYEITAAPGVWRAMRLDNQATLIAIGPGELRDLITADYTARPVPRSCPCPEIRPGVTECGATTETRDADRVIARARQGLSERAGPLPSMPAAPEPHPLITPAEVAEVFQAGPRTVWQWEQAGELDSVRLPSGVRRHIRDQVQALMRREPLTAEQVRAVREQISDPYIGPPGVHSRPFPHREMNHKRHPATTTVRVVSRA